MARIFLLTLLMASATPALAGASSFTLVNGTGCSLADLSIRRAGTQDWKKLGDGPGAGGRSQLGFKDPDCAFDIRATVVGSGPVTWTGINLCAARSVILNRDGAAGAWVDYDQ